MPISATTQITSTATTMLNNFKSGIVTGSERDGWIDSIKAIAIFLVLMGHYIEKGAFHAYIYAFHMHLFFFISGFLYRQKHSFTTLLNKRIKTLLAPYFIFSLIQLGFFILRKKYGRTPDLSASYLQKLCDIFTWNEFWFLGVLFLVSITFFFIAERIKSKKDLLVFALLCTSLHYIISTYFMDIIHENLLKCFIAGVYYCCGYYLRDRIGPDTFYRIIDRKPFVFVCFVLGSAILFKTGYERYGFIDFNFSGNYLYYYSLSLTGIIISISIAQHIRQNVLFSFVGANTIIIYMLEGYPPAIIRRFIQTAFNFDNFGHVSFGYAILYSSATILILSPFIYLINTYVPFLIGRKKEPLRNTSINVIS